MDSEDSDTLDESHEQYPELMKRVHHWAEVISSDTRRRNLENAGKVYCYSPIIFGRDHFGAGWSREVTDRLLTNMQFEIDPSDCFDFLSQMDMMERTYLTVWGTLRDCCGERTQDVAALMHFANHCEDETSIDVILEESLTTPLFDAMRSNIDKDDKAKLTLLLCLKYYFHIVEMVVIKRKNPEKSFNDHPKKTLKKIEELKTKGNALFQRNRYRKAIEYYTEAIKIDCYNPVLYCNRAQANLYLDENWEALLDAKRATLLNPTWPKAYYRFSQALFELQYPQRALTENRLGQQLCRQKDQDIKDLQAQVKRILEEDERLDYLKKNGSTEQPSPLEELDSDELYDESNSEDENEPPAYMDNELLNLGTVDPKARAIAMLTHPTTRGFLETDKRERDRKQREEAVAAARQVREAEMKKAKERKQERERQNRIANEEKRRIANEEKRRIKEEENKRKNQLSKREKKKKLIQDRDLHLEKASTALLEGRSRQAYEDYQNAEIVMEESSGKYGSLTEGGRVIFLYAHGTAALETANPQLFPVAMEKFDIILTQHNGIRTALPYYGKAKALYLMNKFQDALSPIEDGCVIAEKFPCSVETWPGVNTNIEETESASKMMQSLTKLREQCLNPRPPEAICRLPECESTAIYFNDIEFVGFVKVCCSDLCKVDYHTECWRKLRAALKRKTDRDMLDSECCTPDCPGLIHDISILGADALVKSHVTRKEPSHEKVKAVKPASKQSKKKAKKTKSKDKIHKDGTHHQEPDVTESNEGTVAESSHPVDSAPLAPPEPLAPPVKVVQDHQEEPRTTVDPLQFEEEADTALLHQEPVYILKKESPDQVEELQKKAPSKSSKAKSKKKKEVITLRFYDQPSRHLMTAEDAPETAPVPDALCLGYQSGASNQQSSWLQRTPQQLPVIILTEEERSQVLVLQIHFLQILEDNGPLKINDPILTDEVQRLPIDSQELVSRHGGLPAFLCVSEDIDMVENYVCRSCDRAKCESIVEHQKVVWAPLPQPGPAPAAQRLPSGGANRPSWAAERPPAAAGSSHKKLEPIMNTLDTFNGESDGPRSEPEPNMNTLDTFDVSSDSDGSEENSGTESMLSDDEEDGNDSSLSGFSSPTRQSVGEPTSPPWTPGQDGGLGQSAIIGEDMDVELDQLISEERLTFGDTTNGPGGSSSQGIEGARGSVATLEPLSGNIPVDDCSVRDGFDQESQGGTIVVDQSDGKRITAGINNSILCGNGDVSVDRPETESAKMGSEGTCVDSGLVNAQGDGDKLVVDKGGVVFGGNPNVPPGLALPRNITWNVAVPVNGTNSQTQNGNPTEGSLNGLCASHTSNGSETSIGELGIPPSGGEILDLGPTTLDDSDVLTTSETNALDVQTKLDGDSEHKAQSSITGEQNNSESAISNEQPSATNGEQIGTEPGAGSSNAQSSASDSQLVTNLGDEYAELSQGEGKHSVESSNPGDQPLTPADRSVVGPTGLNDAAYLASAKLGEMLEGDHFDLQSAKARPDLTESGTRCSSGEVVSSNSSGVSSVSTTVSAENAVLQERLTRCVGLVRTVSTLCPDLNVPQDARDDEALLDVFADVFYKYVEALKAADAPQREKASIGVGTTVAVATKYQNTDPLQTYLAEYQQAEKKCQNLHDALKDALTKYTTLNQLLVAERAEGFQQIQAIEEMQRKLLTAEESKANEVGALQMEKSSLLLMVHNLEAQTRATQETLQEYNEAKEIMNQTQSERDSLAVVKAELEQKIADLSTECQQQKQRANKSEVSIVQIHKEQALKPLTEAIKECEFHVLNLNQVLARDKNPSLTVILNDWERCLNENKQKLETTTNQFDGQIQELHSGKVLTDLPVIPRPEPSRSKTLNKQPPPPHQWPRFGGPPMPFPPPPHLFNGPPPPFRPPATVHLPPGVRPPIPHQQTPQGPPQPPQGVPAESTQPQPAVPPSTHPASVSSAPTPPVVTSHLPPARGAGAASPAMPGTTMPLARGHGEVVQASNSHPAAQQHQQPIGTRTNGVNSGMDAAQGRGQVNGVQHAAQPQMAAAHRQGHVAQAAGPQRPHPGHGAAAAAPGPRSSYQRLMDRLGSKFPAYNKIQLTNFLRIIRINNGNSLSGLSMDAIIQKVEDLVFEAQAKIPHRPFADGTNQPVPASRAAPVAKIPAAPSQNPWSALDDPTPPSSGSGSWSNEVYNDEVDPCVICHDEMSLKDVMDLECGHRFHADCIQEWLQTKSTCPNCRKFTKLKADFPPLL